jgi:hypothetical protein
VAMGLSAGSPSLVDEGDGRCGMGEMQSGLAVVVVVASRPALRVVAGCA